MEFTKAEWKLKEAVVGHPHYNIMNDSVVGVIAHIPPHAKQFEANARLIASAPDLYEALKYLMFLVKDILQEHENLESYKMAEQAIAKAEQK